MSTLHTTDASESVSRILSAFPPHQRDQARHQFANMFKGVVSQRLVPRADGRGRVPAVEIMLSTARIRELILENATARTITENIAKGFVAYGMQTFDQSLLNLLQGGMITYEEALHQCSNPDDFALRVSGVASGENDAAWANFEPKKSSKSAGGGKDDFDLDEFEIERF
jgi:twitching motility protein PilT